MSKFSRLLSKCTSLVLTTILLFTSVQLPVFAEEENSQTGSTVLTETGSTLLEEQETDTVAIILNTKSGSNILEESSTGEIILEENTLTGSEILPAVETVTETGSLVHEIKEKKSEIKKIEKEEIKFKRKWTGDEIKALGYMPDEVLIKFKKNKIDLKKSVGKEKMKNFIAQKSPEIAVHALQKLEMKRSDIKGKFNSLGNNQKVEFKKDFLQIKQTLDPANLSLVKLGADESVEEIIEALSNDPYIEYIMPNYVFTLNSVVPNDTYYASQWAFNNTAQSLATPQNNPEINNDPVPQTSTNDSDIDMFDAWDEVTETGKVVVAVLDTGVKYDHSDLNNNMWDGSVCYGTGGTSVEDLIEGGCPNYGWDFAGNDPNPMDTRGHGTGVAGIIAAEQNFLGIAGTTKNVEIMAVRVCDDDEGCDLFDVTQGVYFAKHNGAKIINISLGQLASDQDTQEDLDERFNLKGQMQAFIGSGGLVVASAGNDANNNDVTPQYPSSFTLDGIISVAATDQSDNIPYFDGTQYFAKEWGSNWGADSVDVAAPGVNILTTDKDGNYSYKHATSMAAPFVTGLAAMLWAERPELSATDIKQIIMDTGDTIADLDPSNPNATHPIKSGKRINAYNAILAVKALNEGDETSTGSIVLEPTIHSKTAGGDWNSYTTWQENDGLDCSVDDCVLPTSDDVVEINGTVELLYSHAISGLLVSTGAVLQTDIGDDETLTINGDVINNGTVKSYQASDQLRVNLNGDIENNGTWNPYLTWLLSDVNVINTTTLDGYIYTYGENALIVNSPQELTLLQQTYSTTNLKGSGKVKMTGNVINTLSGSIAILEVVDGGRLDSTLNVSNVVLTGSGSRRLYYNLTVNGDLTIGSDVVLETYPNYDRTLTINGDIINNGTVRSYNSNDRLTVSLNGDIENNGTWNPYMTQLLTDVNVVNTTTLGGYIYTYGENALIVNSPQELTLLQQTYSTTNLKGSGKVKMTGNVINTLSGSIAILEVVDGGRLDSTLNVSNVVLTGSGSRRLYYNLTVNGDLTIGSDVVLETYPNYDRTLTINGDIINNGTVKSYQSGDQLTVSLNGDIENNGTWSPYQTKLTWLPTPNATTYEFQITDTNNNWQDPETTNVTYRTIPNSYMNPSDGYRWRTRALVNGVYTDWSATKSINDYQSTQTVTPSGSVVTLTNTNASVEFPENATSQDLQVSIAELDDTGELPPVATNYSLISTAYDFTATNLQGVNVTSFDDNVTITLKYNPDNLGEIEASTLKVNYYDEVNEAWVELPSIVDTVNHTVTANVNHFTDFAILGSLIPKVGFKIVDADSNPISGAQFSTDDKATWQNLPASFDLPPYNEPYTFKWADYQFHDLFRFLQGNAYEINLVTDEITSQASTGTTATFVLDTTYTTLRVLDQNYVEIPDATVGINGIIDQHPTGSGFTLVNGVERQFTFFWRNEFYQVDIEIEKGKINRYQGGIVTKIDSPDGTTQIEFILPTMEVSVHTVNTEGDELSGGTFSVHSLGDVTMNSGSTFLMANGGSTHFYGTWNSDTTRILNLQIQKGKLYQINTQTEIVTTSDIGGETARVEFIHNVISVVVRNIDQSGNQIGGIVKLNHIGTTSYASGHTYQLANGAQESFKGIYGGEYRSSYGSFSLTIQQGKTHLINAYNDRNIDVSDSADGKTYVDLRFNVISVLMRTVNQNGTNLGGGTIRVDNVTYNTGSSFMMASGARKTFYAKYGGITYYKGLNVSKGKLYSIDSQTNVLTTTNSPDGITRVEFVIPTIRVKISTVDNNGNHVAVSRNNYGAWTTYYGSPKTVTLQMNLSKTFTSVWPHKTSISQAITPEEGKIYTLTTTGATVTSTGGTLSEVRFVFPYSQ